MKLNFRITNGELFTEKVESLEIDVNGNNIGDVTINDQTISGEHGDFDYEIDYGFILETPKFMIVDSTSTNAIYIDHNRTNCELEENAQLYDSLQEAQSEVDANEWGEWASIKSIENRNY